MLMAKRKLVKPAPATLPKWDSKAERWRLSGRFVAPPKLSQLRQDKLGRAIDGGGKRVPKSAILSPERKRKPPKPGTKPRAKSKPRPKPKLRIPSPPLPTIRKKRRRVVERVSGGDRWTWGEGKSLAISNLNRTDIDRLSHISEKVIEAAASKTPFEPGDLHVFGHGISLVGGKALSENLISLIETSAPPGIKVRLHEDSKSSTVYINLGDKAKWGDSVSDSFNYYSAWLNDIYESLADYWGATYWSVWFEVDEEMY